MLQLNDVYLGDCYELIKQLPDNSVDCIYTDIPYITGFGGVSTSVVSKQVAKINEEIREVGNGIDYSIFQEFLRVLKHVNIFI